MLCTVQQYKVQCEVSSLQCAVCSVQSAVCSEQRAIQYAVKCRVFRRSATVHEKCRGWVHAAQSRNIGDFFGPSQSSIGPHQLFWAQFWRLPLFSPPTQSRIQPPQTFFWAQLCPGHLLSSWPIKVYLPINRARAQSQSRACWADSFSAAAA